MARGVNIDWSQTTRRWLRWNARSLSAFLIVAMHAHAAHAGGGHGKPRLLQVPLRIRVARCTKTSGRTASRSAVRDSSWVKRHLAAANRVFAPWRIALSATIDSFTPKRCQLLTRAHRNDIARHVSGPAVHVVVVERARDLDVPTYDLMGVHWRGKGKHWVLLTARARPPVLAHELCHYFGLPHDRRGGNLMTPGPSSPAWKAPANKRPRPFAPRLTRQQARRVRRAIAGMLNR